MWASVKQTPAMLNYSYNFLLAVIENHTLEHNKCVNTEKNVMLLAIYWFIGLNYPG